MKKFLRILVLSALCLMLLAAAVPGLAEEAEQAASVSPFCNTVWSLLPPVIAIALALATKEVYSSLFLGVLAGSLLYANGHLGGMVLRAFSGGIITSLTDSYNMGILVFLVFLGTLVCMMNHAGGSAAFGRWAQEHIHTRVGAQLATIALGCLIFIDDYFNCLTVGSVMRPVTDKHQISRAKLAYLIDATAAPVCIIAPVSSWAAAVSGFAENGQGLNLFIRAIPFNFYAILTIVMMVSLTLMKEDFGPMQTYERNAAEGDLFSGKNPYAAAGEEKENGNGRVADLVCPVVILILCCVVGMIYSGGFFGGVDFITAFSNSDASVGLMLGSAFALLFTIIYYLFRRVLKFSELMNCFPDGFKAMVPAILILTLAWTLKGTTDDLGAKVFVRNIVNTYAADFTCFLPALVFVIGALLAFATGTSWGTFGMLIPIVQGVFQMNDPLCIVCISACMAGAVCGDHCSPISDTTIMASAGAQCDHVTHVSTQLPYAVFCAVISFFCYVIAGFVPKAVVMLPLSIVIMAAAIYGMKFAQKNMK